MNKAIQGPLRGWRPGSPEFGLSGEILACYRSPPVTPDEPRSYESRPGLRPLSLHPNTMHRLRIVWPIWIASHELWRTLNTSRGESDLTLAQHFSTYGRRRNSATDRAFDRAPAHDRDLIPLPVPIPPLSTPLGSRQSSQTQARPPREHDRVLRVLSCAASSPFGLPAAEGSKSPHARDGVTP